MEKKTMLLHLASRGAVQIEMCFLIADKSIVMVLYQNYVFFAKKKKKKTGFTSSRFSCSSRHKGH